MNKLIIGAVSVLLMLSMTGMAMPFDVTIHQAVPNATVDAGNPFHIAPGATQTFSMHFQNMVNATGGSLFNITLFHVSGPVPLASIALNYTSNGGPVIPGSIFGFIRNGTDGSFGFEGGYVSPDAFNITIPVGAVNGSNWTLDIGFNSFNESDNASASRTIFAFIPAANISGRKFNDLDNSSTINASEPGLSGWKINLTYTDNGTFAAQTTTDINGNYAFTWLPVGNYTVSEVPQPGWIQTYPTTPGRVYNITLNGVDVTGNDFGNFLPPPPTGNISGRKFNDSDDSGTINASEPGLQFWTIQLKNATNGSVVATTVTDANGNYSFNNIPTGNYIVAEVLKGGWTQTFPLSVTYSVTLTANANVTGNDFGNFFPPPPPTPPANQSLRIYGEDDIGPGTQYGPENPVCSDAPNIYVLYNDSFNPGVIPKDSVTFNPAIIQWDAVNFPMSNSTDGGFNLDVKKFLRIWYEPNHMYNGCLENPTWHPTLEVESTYMLIDSKHMMPTTGGVNTTFAFPIAETAGQIGLGSFNGSGNQNGQPDLVNLDAVNGTAPYTDNGTVAISHLFVMTLGQQVQFLDHKLKLVDLRVDPKDGKTIFAKVEITYAGNLVDDSARQVELGDLQNDPTAITFFDRHNNPDTTHNLSDRTWYAQFKGYSPGDNSSAQIIVGKILSAGTTFYVNSVRYDVPAVNVEFVNSQYELKYITLRTPLPKGTDVPLEASVVTSQWISEVPSNTPLPLDPPFNMVHDMVADINIDLSSAPGLQVSPFPGDKNTQVSDRILNGIPAINSYWKSEDVERRYHTILEEILYEPLQLVGGENWTFMHVQTKPDNYTELVLPSLPNLNNSEFLGDYLVTLSFYANNSNKSIDHIRSPNGMPRAVFVYDAQLDPVFSKDIYINDVNGSATVRVYGENDIGPGTMFGWQNPVQLHAPMIYSEYDNPFDPAEIPKDSITFNPAIIQWDADNFTMSADSHNIDVKKFLRMWYEPNHTYNGQRNNPTYHPTIEVESTYLLMDSKHKLPISGSAGMTTFAFPIANGTRQIGLGSFNASGNANGMPDLVDLALVTNDSNAVFPTTNGTIRIQHTFTMSIGDTVQFLDHMLTLNSLVENATDHLVHAKVQVKYAGNTNPDAIKIVDLGTAGDARAITFFNRDNTMYAAPQHPDITWYAELEFYSYDRNSAQITVGKEISAGDTFYVKSVRYDVPAVNLPVLGEFKYITLRTPLPKGNSNVDPEASVVSSQSITEVPPNSRIPVDPPFNGIHNIVDDIDTPHSDRACLLLAAGAQTNSGDCHGSLPLLSVSQRIIGPYPALDVEYVSETWEPRYRTNMLEILNETIRRDPLGVSETWWYYNITTLPINYTEFRLPPDFARKGQPLHNDYLVTLSWLAPDSQDYMWINLPWVQHDIIDEHQFPYNRRVAFVFDAIDSTGLYVNELGVQTPPGPPSQAPQAMLTANATVQAFDTVIANPSGTSSPNSNPLLLDFNWGDGTPDTVTTVVANVTHQYSKHGLWNIILNVTDLNTGLVGAANAMVNVTNDGVKISFKAGWNQISTSVNNSTAAGSLLAGVPGYVQTWRWNRTTQAYEAAGGAPLQVGQGYFVFASGAADVIIRGTGTTLNYSQLNIVTGWNNVGPGMDSISKPTAGFAYHWNPTTNSYDTTMNLDPGKGYWILNS
jgi:hypothetical protein